MHHLKYSDLWWLLAYPLYQVIGTARHEAAHALIAWTQGVQIERFVVFPQLRPSGGVLWGYVRLADGQTNWLTNAAPYFLDLLTFVVFFLILWLVRVNPRWLWLNLLVIGLVSPLFNSLYNYLGLTRASNDVNKLLFALPDGCVHAYFFLTVPLYVWGLWILALKSQYSSSSLSHKPKLPNPNLKDQRD